MESNLNVKEEIDLLDAFKVEELEERLEFGKWSAEASGGYSQSQGAHVEASVKMQL